MAKQLDDGLKFKRCSNCYLQAFCFLVNPELNSLDIPVKSQLVCCLRVGILFCDDYFVILPSIGLTPCQARQKLSKGLLGEFVPKCKDDGSYEPLQSHEGYSWCVDEDGKEINGTRMRFKQPTCQLQALKSSKLVLMTFRILWIYS